MQEQKRYEEKEEFVQKVKTIQQAQNYHIIKIMSQNIEEQKQYLP